MIIFFHHLQNIPVLSRSKGIEREIDEAKLEYKARKAINMEKKKLASKDRVKADLITIDYERKLRKLATRGGHIVIKFIIIFVLSL
jgi:hypothetical protein